MNQDRLFSKIRQKLKFTSLVIANRPAFQIIRRVRKAGWTYLSESALAELYASVATLEQAKIPGIIVEAGCALGGSAIAIAQAKQPARPFYVYDAFGMIPPPSDRDNADAHARYAEIAAGRSSGVKGGKYYGYEDDLLSIVETNFAQCGLNLADHSIHLIKGFYENTLVVNQPVAFAHIDCDWHDSVMVCLEQIEPHLVRGGTLVIDDYDDWSGCKTAVDAYFANRRQGYEFVMKSRLHIIRR